MQCAITQYTRWVAAASVPSFSRGLLFGIEVVGLQGIRGGAFVICSFLLLPLADDKLGYSGRIGPWLAFQVVVH